MLGALPGRRKSAAGVGIAKSLQEDWDTPAKVKAKYSNASIVGDNRVVFNIKGNAYRLVAKINYPKRIVYVRFVGTHAKYDEVDVQEV